MGADSQGLEAGPLADAVSKHLCGRSAVGSRKFDDEAVVYNAITKAFTRMLDPDDEGHFYPAFQRVGHVYSLRHNQPDLMAKLPPSVDFVPGKAQYRVLTPEKLRAAQQSSNRSSAAERKHLSTVLQATGWVCAGCGKMEPRISLRPWQADLIVPSVRGGQPVLGNIAPTCWPCNAYKGTGNYEQLWALNDEKGMMWDPGMARFALDACLELKPSK